MTSPSSLRFAHDLIAIAPARLGSDVLDHVRLRMFDTIGAMAIGAAHAGVARLKPRGRDWSSHELLMILCAAARGSEIDDIHIAACVTPGSVAVPVALALGSEMQAREGAMAHAIVAGYEAMVRIGEAIDGANCIYQGVWTSAFAAPIGAAAAAGVLLSLDSEQFAHALAIAATRAIGSQVGVFPDTTRWIGFGMAAAEGLASAHLAAAGFKGDLQVFETAMTRWSQVDFDPTRLQVGAAGQLAIEQVDTKPFIIARQALSAVQAAREAQAALEEKPSRITVRVPAQFRRMIDTPDLSHVSIASVQGQIACALGAPSWLYSWDRAGFASNPDLLAVAKVVNVEESPALTALYPRKWGAEVEMVSSSGQRKTSTVLDPIGSSNAPLRAEDIALKLEQCLGVNASIHQLAQLSADFATAPDCVRGELLLATALDFARGRLVATDMQTRRMMRRK